MKDAAKKGLVLMLFALVFHGIYMYAFECMQRIPEEGWILSSEQLFFDYDYDFFEHLTIAPDVNRVGNLALGISFVLLIIMCIYSIVKNKRNDLFPVSIVLIAFHVAASLVLQVWPADMIVTGTEDSRIFFICFIAVSGVMLLLYGMMILNCYVKVNRILLKSVIWIALLGHIAFFAYKCVYLGLFFAAYDIQISGDGLNYIIMLMLTQISGALAMIFFLCAMYIVAPAFYTKAPVPVVEVIPAGESVEQNLDNID